MKSSLSQAHILKNIARDCRLNAVLDNNFLSQEKSMLFGYVESLSRIFNLVLHNILDL